MENCFMNKSTPKNLNDRVSYAQNKIKTAYVFFVLSIVFILISFFFFGLAIIALLSPIRNIIDDNYNIVSLNTITSEINLHSEFQDLISSMDQKNSSNLIGSIMPYFSIGVYGVVIPILTITILKNLLFLLRSIICRPYETLKWKKCYNFYLKNDYIDKNNKPTKSAIVKSTIYIAMWCLGLIIFTILLPFAFDWIFRVQRNYLSESEVELLQFYKNNRTIDQEYLHDYLDKIKIMILIGQICNILILVFTTVYSCLVDIDTGDDNTPIM